MSAGGFLSVCFLLSVHILLQKPAKDVFAEMEQNQILLRGQVTQAPVFSHESHHTGFWSFPLSVPRLSGTTDTLNLLVREDLAQDISTNDKVSVTGTVRSFNNRSGCGSRLVITVLVHTITPWDGPCENTLILSGTLCKPPIFRRTPLGREICDLMLAVPRHYGRVTDFLPCIAWGSLAAQTARLSVGSPLCLEGRLQSRIYTKLIDEQSVEKVAYEISILSLLPQTN